MSEPSCFIETPPLRKVEPDHQVACCRCDVSRGKMNAAEKTSLEAFGGK
jgi:hypothetical protein